MAVLILPLLALPIAIPAGWVPPSDRPPMAWLLGLLWVADEWIEDPALKDLMQQELRKLTGGLPIPGPPGVAAGGGGAGRARPPTRRRCRA